MIEEVITRLTDPKTITGAIFFVKLLKYLTPWVKLELAINRCENGEEASELKIGLPAAFRIAPLFCSNAFTVEDFCKFTFIVIFTSIYAGL